MILPDAVLTDKYTALFSAQEEILQVMQSVVKYFNKAFCSSIWATLLSL